MENIGQSTGENIGQNTSQNMSQNMRQNTEQSRDDSLNSLIDKIKTKTEQDKQAIENMSKEQFSSLQQSFIASSKDALNTTEAVILHQLTTLEENVTSRYKILNQALGMKCLQSLLLGFCLIIGMSFGAGGLITLAEKKIISLNHQINELITSKNNMEQTVTKLQKKTWGLILIENEQGRFILLPPKIQATTDWQVGQRMAIKLE